MATLQSAITSVNSPQRTIVSLPLAQIIVDPDIQSRAAINSEVIADYAESMRTGAKFPPVIVFDDGSKHLAADGFHRLVAAAQAGCETIECDIRKGTKADAIVFSACANGAHGLRRNNADKRRSVELVLGVPAWRERSNRQIADAVGVGHQLVAMVRKALGESSNGTRLASDGRRYPAVRVHALAVTDSDSEAEAYWERIEAYEAEEAEYVSEMRAAAVKSPSPSNRWLRGYDVWSEEDRIAEMQNSMWNAATCWVDGLESMGRRPITGEAMTLRQRYEEKFQERGWDAAQCKPVYRRGAPWCPNEETCVAHLARCFSTDEAIRNEAFAEDLGAPLAYKRRLARESETQSSAD